MNGSIAIPMLCQSRSLYLRHTVPNDAALLFDQGFSQREFMRLFRLNDTPKSQAEVHQNLVQRQQILPDRQKYLELLIVHKKHGAIGLAALADYSPLHRRAEYLIGLFDSTHRGIGHGIETTLLVLDLAFNSYKLHKVSASTYGYNPRRLEGLGFCLEGKRKDHIFDPIANRFVDLQDYGLTVDAFRQNQRLVPLSKRLLNRDITQAIAVPQHRPDAIAQSGHRILRSPPKVCSF